MHCPFLEEAHVGRCSCSALRVMVVRPTAADHERCSSPEYPSCPAYRPAETAATADKCPYLDESPMQYCAAAPVVKYIRPVEALLSRCSDDRFRYCDLYLAMAHVGRTVGDVWVENLRVPERLWYAPNHMWLDPGFNGTCFVGADAFLAATLGGVERLRFPSQNGVRRPAVILTVRGVDFELVFPRPLFVKGFHSYLRANPNTVVEDPYGRGWLFECERADTAGLLHGEAAVRWMRAEAARLAAFVHARLENASPAMPADGGVPSGDFLNHLGRNDLIRFFEEFFPPCGGSESQS